MEPRPDDHPALTQMQPKTPAGRMRAGAGPAVADSRRRPGLRATAVPGLATGLAAGLVAGLAACTPPGPATTPSTSGVSVTLDPNRPPEPMTGLPADPQAMTSEIRRRLLAEWGPLLRESGLRLTDATFWLWLDTTRGDGWRSRMTVGFGALPQSQWAAVEGAMARAAAANGWGQAGVSHGLSQRKGPFFLTGGCSVSIGCSALDAEQRREPSTTSTRSDCAAMTASRSL
jgi:hypothetical protein